VIESIFFPDVVKSIRVDPLPGFGKWLLLSLFLVFSIYTKTLANAPEKKITIMDPQTEWGPYFTNLTAVEQQMLDSLKGLVYSNNAQIIYQNRGNYYAINDCSLAVYHWKGDKWILYAGKDMTGANCSSSFFFKGEEIYAFSGMGYWQGQMDLFHFTKAGQVNFVKTVNQPEDFFGTMNFAMEKGYYSFFGNRLNRRKGIKDFLWKGYFLDFSDWTWKEVEFERNENFEKVLGADSFDDPLIVNAFFETSDYAFIEITNSLTEKVALLIVDRRTSTTYIKPLVNHQFQGFTKWMQQEGNNLRFFNFFKSAPREFNLDELVKTAFPLGGIVLKESTPFSAFEIHPWVLFMGSFLIPAVFFAFWKFYRPRRSPLLDRKSTEWEKSNFSILLRMRHYTQQVITQEEMDTILGIQEQKNPDIRKVSRSRAIKSINEAMESKIGRPIISRVRDKVDKRVILYRIEEFSTVKTPSKPNLVSS
jgi:hypothetical protein